MEEKSIEQQSFEFLAILLRLNKISRELEIKTINNLKTNAEKILMINYLNEKRTKNEQVSDKEIEAKTKEINNLYKKLEIIKENNK